MKILFCASEAAPWVKTGGLGDVMQGLPHALSRRGHEVKLVIPRYGTIPRDALRAYARPLAVPLGTGLQHGQVLEGPPDAVQTWFLEHNGYFDRPWPYGPPGGEYADNVERFVFLSRGAIALCRAYGLRPDVIHVNDWQTSLIPALLAGPERRSPAGRAATVLTIHNIGYQGTFAAAEMRHTALAPARFNFQEFEHEGGLNLLKGGIYHADQITTVSPTHAVEIQTPGDGFGLDGAIRMRADDLTGILNGIDDEIWNPANDPLLPATYSPDDLSGKRRCKEALQQAAGLPVEPALPLLGVISRMTHQKGTDVLLAALDRILSLDLQLVVLGSGDPDLQAAFEAAQIRHPDRLSTFFGYSEPLAHRIEAGADLFLMPSRYEPGGLNQLYSQRYGTLPIVRNTGGLADSVESFDEALGRGTGFAFDDLNPAALFDVVGWAVHTWYNHPHAFRAMMIRGMKRDFGWDAVAGAYEQVYRRAAARRAPGSATTADRERTDTPASSQV